MGLNEKKANYDIAVILEVKTSSKPRTALTKKQIKQDNTYVIEQIKDRLNTANFSQTSVGLGNREEVHNLLEEFGWNDERGYGRNSWRPRDFRNLRKSTCTICRNR